MKYLYVIVEIRLSNGMTHHTAVSTVVEDDVTVESAPFQVREHPVTPPEQLNREA